MNERDPAALGRLAESVIWPAIDLVGLIRGGLGDHQAVGKLYAKLSDDQMHALPVVLAAMVDHSKTLDELLAWITFDEYGRQLTEPRTVSPRWRVPMPCGTKTAFDRHMEAGEEPDAACEKARQEYQQNRDAQAKAREQAA